MKKLYTRLFLFSSLLSMSTFTLAAPPSPQCSQACSNVCALTANELKKKFPKIKGFQTTISVEEKEKFREFHTDYLCLCHFILVGGESVNQAFGLNRPCDTSYYLSATKYDALPEGPPAYKP